MSSNYTRTMITGNLCRDVAVSERTVAATGEIKKVANFTVASNFERRNGEKGVTFYRASLWGDDAVKAAELMKKGALSKVEGTLVPNTWTDRDGNVHNELQFHGNTRVHIWDRANKKWLAVNPIKAEAEPAPVAEAPAGINAEVLPF